MIFEDGYWENQLRGGGDGFWRTEFQSRRVQTASFGDNRLNPKGGLRYTIEVQCPHFVFPLTRSATPPGRQLCVPVLRFGAKSGTCTGVFQYSFPGFRPVAVEVSGAEEMILSVETVYSFFGKSMDSWWIPWILDGFLLLYNYIQVIWIRILVGILGFLVDSYGNAS